MNGVALVTGGQRGIGLAIAQALAASGMKVAVASNVPAKEAQATMGDTAADRYVQFDVTDLDRIDAVLDEIESELGAITTLVNNAGIGAPVRGDLLELQPQNWDLVQNVNLRGPFFLSQAVAARMLRRTSDVYRAILFITSVSAEIVSDQRAEYCVSKAGASMVAKLFATRLAADGIGVFELRPGIIATDMTAGVRDAYEAQIARGLVPARRWGTPADIGTVAAACALGQLQFATGAAIPVDGGLSIPRL